MNASKDSERLTENAQNEVLKVSYLHHNLPHEWLHFLKNSGRISALLEKYCSQITKSVYSKFAKKFLIWNDKSDLYRTVQGQV